MKKFNIKKVVRGNVEAQIIVNPGAFSFLGDIDLETAEIIVENSPNKGLSIAGKILIFDETKGSSGGASVLQTLKNIGKAPAAIISVKPADFNLTEAAILTGVPYASGLDKRMMSVLKTGQKASVKIDQGVMEVAD